MTAERFRIGLLVLLVIAIWVGAHLAHYDYLGEWVRADRWTGFTEYWSCIDPMDEPLKTYEPLREGKYVTYYDEHGLTMRGENIDCRWRTALPVDIDLSISP